MTDSANDAAIAAASSTVLMNTANTSPSSSSTTMVHQPQLPASSSSSYCSKVRVGVRVRPLTSREEGEGGQRVLKVHHNHRSNNDNQQQILQYPEIRLGQRKFAYDAVFDSNVSQNDLYRTVSPPLLKSFVNGYNATIMAYGQTGSGKTFTMGSESGNTELRTSSSTGLIPRFMNDLFLHLQNQQQQDGGGGSNNKNACAGEDTQYTLRASFLEVYGEDVYDLLDPSRPSLPLREDSNGGVVCAGLTSRPIHSSREALQVLHEGTMHRTTAATLMNLTSSRSHAVFTITLTTTTATMSAADQQESAVNTSTSSENSNISSISINSSTRSSALRTSNGSNNITTTTTTTTTVSKFTFVDLAGSERMKKTGAEGERAREGIKINEGLLALGNVINALSESEEQQQHNRKVHVPYRQSKLTRLLQDALGGNSQTLFLACVSPSDTNSSETLSTLHYANRARNIRNAPTKNNIDSSGNSTNNPHQVAELRRLQSLVGILERELVKNVFGNGGGGDTENGNISNLSFEIQDEAMLFQRPDVVEYLSKLHSKAQDPTTNHTASARSKPLALMPNKTATGPPPSPLRFGTISSIPEGAVLGTPNKSVMENYDPSLLAGVNPDEEMAILDQLLELQNRDNEFDDQQKLGDAELKQVEGELAKQENMLLQLRDSLKLYHDMKGKYEALMAEVQHLEVEKAELAEQLERAQADPSKGCSKAIKKRLDKVEQALARTRNESRNYREKVRKSEQEAKKCAVLQRKITELKTGRANLMKKQKEAAAKHREYTQSKTREIMALKKKDRSNEQRLSKLQNEVQRQKKNLDKRQEYCSKLSSKLKQTEAHLMKMLSLRRRELHRDYRTAGASGAGSHFSRRATTSVFGSRRVTNQRPHRQTRQHQQEATAAEAAAAFAPPSQALTSIQYLLNEALTEKVEIAELASRYEERVAGYGEAMRQLVDAVKKLEQSRKDANSDDDGGVIRDLEQSVEEMELKVELVGEEMESLRSQLATVEANIDGGDVNEEEEDRVKMLVKDKDAPILRSILVETCQKMVQVQINHNQLDRAAQRNESVRRGLENEVESLNERLDALNKDLAQARSIQTLQEDPVDTIKQLQADKTNLSTKLTGAEQEVIAVKRSEKDLREQKKLLETELCEVKERLTLLESTKKQHECAASAAEGVLDSIQGIWRELGVPTDQRDQVRLEIENCLDDTCSRKLEEAKKLRENMRHDLDQLQTDLGNMKAELGMSSVTEDKSSEGTLLERITALRQLKAHLEPSYTSNKERANNMRKQMVDLCNAIGFDDSALADDLKNLRDANAVGNGSLSDDFLGRCEQHLSALRVRKSQMLARNAELLKETSTLVSDMNLPENQILPLVVHSRRQRSMPLPDWWSAKSAEVIATSVSAPGGIVRVACSFYNHLSVVNESLSSLAKGRQILSKTLGELIQRAQKTLLETVEGEIDASEAFASFDETLSRLPSLSKERIHACIAQVNALVSGVDDMTQSEIETLTVVWEALDVSSGDRCKFWGDVDDAVSALETGPAGPFDEVIQVGLDGGEEWVIGIVKDAAKSYRQLETRLFKLEKIHKEVERLRSRKDAKSKIVSLDSEIRILSAKLSEFELKQCNKQRLLTKKTGSSNLLKEERFRKQMQQKFTSKLEQLAKLLKDWRDDEKHAFDINLLSDEVRLLLQNSDNMDVMVEKRTEFMHLRTVKSASKRKPSAIDRETGYQPPPRKRQARAPKAGEGVAEVPSLRPASRTGRATPLTTARKRKAVQKPSTPDRSSKKAAKSARGRGGGGGTPSRKNPFAHLQSPAQRATTRGESAKKRLTLPPFGHVLEQASTPTKKENTNE